MASSRLTTLGGFAFNVNEQWTRGPATRKARALMAYVIMNSEADVARETLLDIFWPDSDPEHARASLKTALWSIRRCLITAGADADDFMLASKSVVRWRAQTTIDALEFAKLAAVDDPSASQEALQLYRGDFLEGDYDNWTIAERERLASLYESVLARVARSSKNADAAQRFIARNPYDEEMNAMLVEAELSAGRRASAASWVERCRKALAEVGEKPSDAFEARFAKMVHVDLPPPTEVTLPFTGRESELTFLAARFRDAGSCRGSTTLVHGEAGIGKSTLLQRAAGIATDLGLRVLAVRCTTDMSGPFGPWQGLFTSLTRADFDSFIDAHSGDIAAAVAHSITGRLMEQTLLIVDDAHQLSAEALEILVALIQAAITRHAVVVAVRPEGVAQMRSRLTETAFEELALAALDRSSLEWALADALAGGQPELFDALYRRSGGHPLFFTGLLNSLVSEGALTRIREHWRLTKAIDPDLELPHTIKHFIETRLHARGDAPRAVACALALEPTANAEDLIAVLGMDESGVFDAIDDLLALGLLIQPETGSPFAFSHDLIREVAAVGLNAGRRAVLHRGYARRLSASRQRDASLRCAHHLYASGEYLAAGTCYLKAAQDALASNAPQDALERCDAGISAARNLEQSIALDVLTMLDSTAARAIIASGDAVEAIDRAREAVALARMRADARHLAEATLDLSIMEGVAYQLVEQRSDAAEAIELAKRCGDQAMQAQALVQYGTAVRELGLQDEALRTCGNARDLALEHGHSEIALNALEELMRAQVTWWLFSDARDSARVALDAAKRSGPMMEAAFLQVRSALWYLLERFGEARADLDGALRITDEVVGQRQTSFLLPLHPRPWLQFACHYMSAKIAIAQRELDEALASVERAALLTNVAKLPRHGQALSLLRIDALLMRNFSDDCETVHQLVISLPETSTAQGLLGWSDCVELARARYAARAGEPHASALLRRALNTLEENAHRAPLDSDRAFTSLAEAASEIGEVVLANRARARSRHYQAVRMAAAGADWGASKTPAI